MASGKSGTKPPHGNYGRYKNHGCRCDKCRRAWSAYMRAYKHRKGGLTMKDYLARRRANLVHGAETGYTRGCRCAACVEAANAARQRRRRENGPGPEAVHGKASTYSNGCRCSACRNANTLKSREYARRRREQVAA